MDVNISMIRDIEKCALIGFLIKSHQISSNLIKSHKISSNLTSHTCFHRDVNISHVSVIPIHALCSRNLLQTCPHTCSCGDVKISHACDVEISAAFVFLAPDVSPHMLP